MVSEPASSPGARRGGKIDSTLAADLAKRSRAGATHFRPPVILHRGGVVALPAPIDRRRGVVNLAATGPKLSWACRQRQERHGDQPARPALATAVSMRPTHGPRCPRSTNRVWSTFKRWSTTRAAAVSAWKAFLFTWAPCVGRSASSNADDVGSDHRCCSRAAGVSRDGASSRIACTARSAPRAVPARSGGLGGQPRPACRT